MATIDVANFDSLKEKHVNISDLVGVGQRNETNDVMAIQALFRLVGHGDFYARKYFGLTARDMPETTGQFDEKTIQAIRAFQRTMSYRLLNPDGKIHPASYQNRVMSRAFSGARLMAITLLNIEALDTAISMSLGNVPDAVKKIAPMIRFT